MKKIILLAALSLGSYAHAELTSGGVNWLDPLGYTKPKFMQLNLPSESAVTNKYYVNLSGGSGTACTQAAPCASLNSVSGKPGTTGGPAIIYVKGSGALGDINLSGSANNEVVIKPWDNNTLATFTGRNNQTRKIQHVVFDGGPNLKIKFSITSELDADASIYFNASTSGLHSHITFYRTQWEVTKAGCWLKQLGVYDNLKLINSEFYATNSSVKNVAHHIYFSGADQHGASSNFHILNNIFRDTPGEAFEFRMFDNLNGLIIDGNAFHNMGKGTCDPNVSWKCRSPITLSDESPQRRPGTPPGVITNIRISNNLFWDTGEGIVRTWAFNPLIINNTVYNWGMGVPANGGYGSNAFFGYQEDGTGTIQNNVIYATGSTSNGFAKSAFRAGNFVTSNNVCASGQSCGSNGQTTGAASFLSLNENSPDFLKPAPTSNISSNGAYQYFLNTTPPAKLSTPKNLRVQ